MLENGIVSGASEDQCPFFRSSNVERDIPGVDKLSVYWGMVINFNPTNGKVETFIPHSKPKKVAKTIKQARAPEVVEVYQETSSTGYADTELLGCRVKMHGVRGMVDSITVGEKGAILFQVQFSDGFRQSMLRSDLEPILSDIDLVLSTRLKVFTHSHFTILYYNFRLRCYCDIYCSFSQ